MQIWKSSNAPIKAWVDGVPVESGAIDQLRNTASMPFIFKHIAVMPDVHIGMGATIGTVTPTKGAVIPSAVGVDIGCGMVAVQTNLTIDDVPQEKRSLLRQEIERLVPHGRTNQGGNGDKGAWHDTPKKVLNVYRSHLEKELDEILKKNPGIKGRHGVNSLNHLGTLGGGNHFIEVCLDLDNIVWLMIHSGSRGVGNRIGQYFIKLAKESCRNGSGKERDKIERELNAYFRSSDFGSLSKSEKKRISTKMRAEAKDQKLNLGTDLPHPDLAFFSSNSVVFDEYLQAVLWAQHYAKLNRQIMLDNVVQAVENICGKFTMGEAVNCHHNYVDYEDHFGERILVTRKGAISAQLGEKGIIPGSMGDKSYIVEGLGNEESFCSASHGAGRKMSRSEAKRTFTVEDHILATEGVECSKDASILDETPAAYKDIDSVIEAEKDLVKPIHQLKQIICIKG